MFPLLRSYLRLELLNLFTGISLVFAGILYFSRGDMASGLNWLIFGCMYLAMDDYKYSTEPRIGIEKITHVARIVFSLVGGVGAIALLMFAI